MKSLIKSAALFLSVSLILSSCVIFSVFPIYTIETLAYDETLIGTWKIDDTTIEITQGEIKSSRSVNTEKFQGGITMTETPGEGDSQEEIRLHKKKAGYTFKITSEDDTLLYAVHLVKISDELYLDFYPKPIDGHLGAAGVDPYTDNLYPVHTFMKIEFDEENLSLINFNHERLNELFKKNLIRLRHEIVFDILTGDKENGDVLITAKPEEIQKFIATYAKDPSVFDQPEVYNRQ